MPHHPPYPPTYTPTLAGLLRDLLGATLCLCGARLLSGAAKADLAARLRGAR
jgi:hypothetical protein